MSDPLLKVENLRVEFQRSDGIVYAVNDVSFSIAPGETVGVVGESGSGKSTALMALLGLLDANGRVTGGHAWFQGADLLKLNRHQLEDIRGRDIGVVFQDPMLGLNPTMRIGDQIMEGMLEHHYASMKQAFQRTLDLLAEVGIPDPPARFRNYPFEFSGGMRQRVMIAMAIACEPQLLIADEPTTALDVTVQMQILALLDKLRRERRMSIIMITHDLGVATNFCDRIIVMYGGKIMETAPLDEFLHNPAHPYTIALFGSMLEPDDSEDWELHPIPGTAEPLLEFPQACPFAPRCSMAQPRCQTEMPQLRLFENEHWIACHRAEEVMSRAG
ncbi:MAG: ABC transporter ATP-binding protein [Firmicutes bacterium]|nr:ABC transporter ATP-binding protein [Bacillota bacterium]